MVASPSHETLQREYSIRGALALSTLSGWSPYLCLALAMAVTLCTAVFGHNLVQVFEKVAFRQDSYMPAPPSMPGQRPERRWHR